MRMGRASTYGHLQRMDTARNGSVQTVVCRNPKPRESVFLLPLWSRLFGKPHMQNNMIGFVLEDRPTSHIYCLCYLQSYFLCLHAFISKSEGNHLEYCHCLGLMCCCDKEVSNWNNETGTIFFCFCIHIFQNPNTFEPKTSSGSLTPSSAKLLIFNVIQFHQPNTSSFRLSTTFWSSFSPYQAWHQEWCLNWSLL